MTIRAGDTGPDIETVQRILQEGGYYSGAIDGVYGPDTEAAVRAYQTAHGLEVDGVVGRHTWGNMHGDPAYPNNTTGALGGGGAGGGSGGTNNSAAEEKVRQEVPEWAFLLSNPEVGPLLLEAYGSNPPMNGKLFNAKLMQTQWWKSNSDTARDYYQLQHTDPATFRREIDDRKSKLQGIAADLGIDLDEGYLEHFANKAFRFGMDDNQMKAMVNDEISPLVGASHRSTTFAAMNRIKDQYGYNLDHQSFNFWAQEINSGRKTMDNFLGEAANNAKRLFPHLSDDIDRGLTLRAITDPYRQILSREFDGLNPEDFDFYNDPKWRHVIDFVDDKGTHRTMSTVEVSRYARQQPEWRRTRAAREQVAEIGDQIVSSFGGLPSGVR